MPATGYFVQAPEVIGDVQFFATGPVVLRIDQGAILINGRFIAADDRTVGDAFHARLAALNNRFVFPLTWRMVGEPRRLDDIGDQLSGTFEFAADDFDYDDAAERQIRFSTNHGSADAVHATVARDEGLTITVDAYEMLMRLLMQTGFRGPETLLNRYFLSHVARPLALRGVRGTDAGLVRAEYATYGQVADLGVIALAGEEMLIERTAPKWRAMARFGSLGQLYASDFVAYGLRDDLANVEILRLSVRETRRQVNGRGTAGEYVVYNDDLGQAGGSFELLVVQDEPWSTRLWVGSARVQAVGSTGDGSADLIARVDFGRPITEVFREIAATVGVFTSLRLRGLVWASLLEPSQPCRDLELNLTWRAAQELADTAVNMPLAVVERERFFATFAQEFGSLLLRLANAEVEVAELNQQQLTSLLHVIERALARAVPADEATSEFLLLAHRRLAGARDLVMAQNVGRELAPFFNDLIGRDDRANFERIQARIDALNAFIGRMPVAPEDGIQIVEPLGAEGGLEPNRRVRALLRDITEAARDLFAVRLEAEPAARFLVIYEPVVMGALRRIDTSDEAAGPAVARVPRTLLSGLLGAVRSVKAPIELSVVGGAAGVRAHVQALYEYIRTHMIAGVADAQIRLLESFGRQFEEALAVGQQWVTPVTLINALTDQIIMRVGERFGQRMVLDLERTDYLTLRRLDGAMLRGADDGANQVADFLAYLRNYVALTFVPTRAVPFEARLRAIEDEFRLAMAAADLQGALAVIESANALAADLELAAFNPGVFGLYEQADGLRAQCEQPASIQLMDGSLADVDPTFGVSVADRRLLDRFVVRARIEREDQAEELQPAWRVISTPQAVATCEATARHGCQLARLRMGKALGAVANDGIYRLHVQIVRREVGLAALRGLLPDSVIVDEVWSLPLDLCILAYDVRSGERFAPARVQPDLVRYRPNILAVGPSPTDPMQLAQDLHSLIGSFSVSDGAFNRANRTGAVVCAVPYNGDPGLSDADAARTFAWPRDRVVRFLRQNYVVPSEADLSQLADEAIFALGRAFEVKVGNTRYRDREPEPSLLYGAALESIEHLGAQYIDDWERVPDAERPWRRALHRVYVLSAREFRTSLGLLALGFGILSEMTMPGVYDFALLSGHRLASVYLEAWREHLDDSVANSRIQVARMGHVAGSDVAAYVRSTLYEPASPTRARGSRSSAQEWLQDREGKGLAQLLELELKARVRDASALNWYGPRSTFAGIDRPSVVDGQLLLGSIPDIGGWLETARELGRQGQRQLDVVTGVRPGDRFQAFLQLGWVVAVLRARQDNPLIEMAAGPIPSMEALFAQLGLELE